MYSSDINNLKWTLTLKAIHDVFSCPIVSTRVNRTQRRVCNPGETVNMHLLDSSYLFAHNCSQNSSVEMPPRVNVDISYDHFKGNVLPT